VIGEGNKHYTKKLKALIDDKQLADNITMMGYQPNLQQLIAQADFGVLPAAWREPFGISNLEYMMQGKAHISTNNGGQVEYLRHFENALLVEPENPSSLASAIQRLIDDKQLRNDLGTQAKDDFDQHLTYKHFYEKIISLYNSL
jgi:glycosyltransferase involved in cell wall biosynthesis